MPKIPPKLAALNGAALERAGLLCRAERRPRADGALECRVWVKAPSRANLHGRVSSAIARNSELRDQTHVALLRLFPARPRGPLAVTMERWAPDAVDGHDNLPTALKSAVDGVAAWLGLDDRDPSVAWHYRQRRTPDWSVVITLRSVASRPAAAVASLDVIDRLGADASPEAEALREAALAFLAAEGTAA